MMKNQKLWRNLLLALVFSLFCLWLVGRSLDWQAAIKTIQGIQWAYSPLILIIWSLSLGIRAIRWYYLLDQKIPLRSTFHIHNIGFLVNNIIPLRAGELLRAYFVTRTDTDISGWTALSTIVTERILDVLAIVLILVLVLPVLSVDPKVVSGGWLVGGLALIIFLLLIYFARNRSQAHRLLRVILRLLPPLSRLHPEELLDRALEGVTPLTGRHGFFRIILWTAISWGFVVLEVWVLTLVFPDLSLAETMIRNGMIFVVVTASLSIIVPFTFAGVGPFEGAVVFALTAVGVSNELALAFALVWHAGLLLTYTIWGIIGMLAFNISLNNLQEELDTYAPPEHL